MLQLEIHQNIKTKLDNFHKNNIVPNIIFHGPSGGGKSTILCDFIKLLYDNNSEQMQNFVMYVNCAHGKGIKFIREELKLFAKTNILNSTHFKSIVLFNADKLTMDAQSALRRCIELFSHTTRFFIVVEDKYKLLKPILSRFCEIYVPLPVTQTKQINLYEYHLKQSFQLKDYKKTRIEVLIEELNKTFITKKISHEKLLNFVSKLYEKGYNGLDLIYVIENYSNLFLVTLTEQRKYQLLIAYNKVRVEFRNEKWLMLFILNFWFLSSNDVLENISFM